MIRVLIAVSALSAVLSPACAADIEHWTCQVHLGSKVYPQDYTLADNRLFAPKGKGSWSLVYNSDDTAFAYIRMPNKDTAMTDILVLDKHAGKMIWCNDSSATAMFRIAPETDPSVQVSECVRKN
jgi:hypothetical protein